MSLCTVTKPSVAPSVSTNIEEMRQGFHTISGGEYAQKLYRLFGKKRVMQELDSFLSHNFFARTGGGIGVTRMISAMQKQAELVKA
jgi:hypothetical protein